MKRSLFSPPDDYALIPLLALLPQVGDTAELSRLTSSLYARFEKVYAMRQEVNSAEDGEAASRLIAEEAMLRTALEWLAVSLPQAG